MNDFVKELNFDSDTFENIKRDDGEDRCEPGPGMGTELQS